MLDRSHSSCFSAVWHPSRTIVLVGGNQGHLSLVELSPNHTTMLTHQQNPHNNWVKTAVFNDTGSLVLSSSFDGSIALHSGHELALIWKTPAHPGTCARSAQFMQKDQIASVGDDATLKIWDLRTGAAIRTFSVSSRCNVTSLAIVRFLPWESLGSLREFCVGKAVEMGCDSPRWPEHLREELKQRTRPS
eukprot:TRINITY_DN3526_c0_g1_i2.p1 TRINITY_DN3526_c0_g1~~TRINITY_DN3526_c0_g1_i2.p1  ORF type:complete len:190 (+),score=19.61 TRINITY_DN3526_c0_g1_i2:538-1107(+)